jgi:phthalate 4,5-dioxygenase
MMQRHCPHRGADLAYGRLEPDGLRCSFHGWKFDAAGKCIETPAEPAGSRMCEQIKTVSYPVVERSGILFGYLGNDAPPAFPAFDCFVAPDAYTFAFKGYWDCNWLQALEVGIDPAHASWLHKYFEDEDPAANYGKQFRGVPADSSLPISKVLREHDRPEIRVERTDYGMRLQTLRRISDAQTHIRVTNILFPQAFVIPMNAEMTITQFHVPVDDTGCYWYAIFTSFGAPVDKDTMRSQRLKTYPAPEYKPLFNKNNSWGFDVDEQRSKTFTGMGFDINIHDQFACESQGPIADRTKENLGTTDKGIVLYRRILLDSIKRNEQGETPLMVLDEKKAEALKGPITVDGIGPTSGMDEYWKESDTRRRKQSKWAA